MTPHSVPVLVAGVLTLYVGAMHLLVYAPRTAGRAHLSFGITCLLIAAYDFICVGLYNAFSVAEGAMWQRSQGVALALLLWAVPWFVSEHLGINLRRWPAYFGLFCALLAVLAAVLPAPLTWQIDIPSVKYIVLPGGRSLIYYEATPGPFINALSVFGFVVILATLWLCLRGMRTRPREALPLLLATVVFGLGIISDTLVSSGLLNVPYAIEYAYLGLVMVMTVPLTRAVADSARMRDALAAEKERLLVTLRSIGDGVIATDAAGRVLMMNEVAEALTGWREEDAVGRALPEVFVIQDERTGTRLASPVSRVVESGAVVGLANHTILVGRDGSRRVIADSGAPIRDRNGAITGVILVFRDTTERRRLEERLVNAQRLESLGVLAGGIAHDFNNLLTGIFGFIDIARLELPAGEARDTLGEAMRTLARARDFSQQLLTFSRGGTPDRRAVRLEPLLRDNTRFALSGTRCTASFSIAPDLWACLADPNQIGQAIDNLVINAQQAMPGGGEVRLSARNVQSPPVRGVADGPYVMVEVSDSGVGIRAEHLRRIFDPFFSTKHRGSGLGLATAYSIVNRHNGTLEVRSEQGHGTTFTILLPALPDASPEEPGEAAEVTRGSGRVLVMDDERSVRTMAARLLSSVGYEADTAEHGAQALEMARTANAAGRAYSACLLDLTIAGGKGGEEISSDMRSACPQVKLVAMSGYSESGVMSDPEAHGFEASLRKPFTTAELTHLLSALLS